MIACRNEWSERLGMGDSKYRIAQFNYMIRTKLVLQSKRYLHLLIQGTQLDTNGGKVNQLTLEQGFLGDILKNDSNSISQ